MFYASVIGQNANGSIVELDLYPDNSARPPYSDFDEASTVATSVCDLFRQMKAKGSSDFNDMVSIHPCLQTDDSVEAVDRDMALTPGCAPGRGAMYMLQL
jgi:hypothetical protein